VPPTGQVARKDWGDLADTQGGETILLERGKSHGGGDGAKTKRKKKGPLFEEKKQKRGEDPGNIEKAKRRGEVKKNALESEDKRFPKITQKNKDIAR